MGMEIKRVQFFFDKEKILFLSLREQHANTTFNDIKLLMKKRKFSHNGKRLVETIEKEKIL